MAPTPPSTASSSGHSPDNQYRVVRKRNRVPLSCAPCQQRKLKCNRSHPCENCARRGDASLCSYAAPGTRKRASQVQESSSPDDMQNRINRLEGLVLSLMTNGPQSAGPAAAISALSQTQSVSVGSMSHPSNEDREDDDMIKEEQEGEDSDVEGMTSSLGYMKVDADKGHSLYLGDSHWHLVLADIAEVRNYFTSHKKELEKNYAKIKESKPSSVTDGPAFLFSSHTPISDDELRGELPSKSAIDKLVSRFFNSHDAGAYTLHSPTFHKQLNNHWRDPSKTCIVWLGLLYSVLCLAMQSYHKIGDEPPEWQGRTFIMAAEYRVRTVQCLVNSEYTRSSPYTLETLILYVQGEYASQWDTEVGIWVIVGMIVRLAMRMGYHRDPSKYSSITPYEAEMRRRIWAIIRSLDTMFSFQLALPGMIRNSDYDTALPRNIYEEEFGPEINVLPPPRPNTVPTPIALLIAKSQISHEFAGVLEEINAVNGRPVSYDDVLQRDNRLRELRSNMAPHLRLRPLGECVHDPASLLMQRFGLDIMWQKTMCVLHRKYIARSRQNPRYAHSRRTCRDASLEILRHQEQLHRESQPGGRMHTMRWFISSLTKNDYLLGAMIVCLDLYYDSIPESMAERPAEYDMHFWTPAQRAEMLQALETSLSIWKESAESSMEAFKASKILTIMLEKIKRPTQQAEGPTSAEVFAQFDDENLKPEHSAAMTLGMLSGGLTPNTAAMFNGMVQSPGGGARFGNMDMNMGSAATASAGLPPSFDGSNPFANLNGMASPFPTFGNNGFGGEMMDMTTNLDWEAWDSYIQNGNVIDPTFQFNPSTVDQSGLSPDGQQTDLSSFGNSVFMGANTPGR